MEYSFRNDGDGTLTQVELKEFQLIVRKAGKVHTIPFSAITHVCLRKKRNSYTLEIRSTDFGSALISYKPAGTKDDKVQSRQYNSFVRILHLQLIKGQCPVEYCSGFRPSNIFEKSGAVFLLAVVAYTLEDYFNPTPLGPVPFALIILCLGGLFLVGSYYFNHSKSYQPTEIPLNLLPAAL